MSNFERKNDAGNPNKGTGSKLSEMSGTERGKLSMIWSTPPSRKRITDDIHTNISSMQSTVDALIAAKKEEVSKAIEGNMQSSQRIVDEQEKINERKQRFEAIDEVVKRGREIYNTINNTLKNSEIPKYTKITALEGIYREVLQINDNYQRHHEGFITNTDGEGDKTRQFRSFLNSLTRASTSALKSLDVDISDQRRQRPHRSESSFPQQK